MISEHVDALSVVYDQIAGDKLYKIYMQNILPQRAP
jgi:hypothetical protein